MLGNEKLDDFRFHNNSAPRKGGVFERWESQAALESARSRAPPFEQAAEMTLVSVAEYNIAEVRPLFGEGTP